MTKYIVRKVGSKKILFTLCKRCKEQKRIGLIAQKWVKVGQKFSASEIKVEGKCVGFRDGWHELALDNEFIIDKDWVAYRVSIKCPTCKKFTHR